MLYAAELLTLAEEKELSSYGSDFSLRMIYADSWAPAIVLRMSLVRDSLGTEMLELKSRGVTINTFGREMASNKIRGETSLKIERYFKFHPQFNLVDSLTALIQKYELYNMNTIFRQDGSDGNSLFLEMLIDGEYKVIHRWTPRISENPQDLKFLEFCRYFAALQSRGIDKVDELGF